MKKFINTKNKNDPTGATMEIMGSSKSGKTYLMVKMLLILLGMKEWKDVLIPVFVTPNYYATAYDDLRPFVKKGRVMIIENVELLPKLFKIMFTINKHTHLHYKFVLFIDDVISQTLQKGIIDELYLIHRNKHISVIMGVQTDTIGGKKARRNTNYTIFKRFNSSQEVEDIIKNYLKGYFPSMNRGDNGVLIDLYNALVENYSSIFLDNLTGDISHLKNKNK